MRKELIFVLSMWRSGTTWITPILAGKNGKFFDREPQILPFITMLKKTCLKKIKNLDSWLPLCDVDRNNEILQLGYKSQKFFFTYIRIFFGTYDKFIDYFMEFVFQNVEAKRIVEKSPQNLSPLVFNTALEVFGNKQHVKLVYLYREFKQYLSSIYYKSVIKSKKWPYGLDYFADKWIKWNLNATNSLQNKPKNLFVIEYTDVVNNIVILDNIINDRHFGRLPKKETLLKWESCPVKKDILFFEKKYMDTIEFIMSNNNKYKFQSSPENMEKKINGW